MMTDRVRIVIAPATPDYDDERFCAELYRNDTYLGRICEIDGSADYSLELEPGTNGEALGAVVEDAKARLLKHKFG